jgi:lysophospholipase L1-like esterase
LPVQDPDGVFDVFSNFTGLRLLSGTGDSPDHGTLVLYRGGTVVASVRYTGAFHAADPHKLSYDVDTRSGAIGAVTLEGSTSDYSAFRTPGAFTEAATAYAALASLCESGRDNQAYASHFVVADNSASPSAPPAPSPAAAAPAANHAPILIHDGDRIGFMGDSITALGNSPKGYVQLVVAGLKAEGVQAAAIPAGHSGDTSGNMVARTNPEVLHQGATWMTLSCGVNDVAAPGDGTGRDLVDFRANVTRMVAKAQGWNVRVLLLTPTPRGEDLDNDFNHRLAAYNDFLRRFAREKNLPLADVNAAFQAVLNTKPPAGAVPGRRLLADGLHPNDAGQFLMATTVLEALGVPQADMPRVIKTLHDGIDRNGQR